MNEKHIILPVLHISEYIQTETFFFQYLKCFGDLLCCKLECMYCMLYMSIYFVLQGSAYLTGCWLHALAGWQSVK